MEEKNTPVIDKEVFDTFFHESYCKVDYENVRTDFEEVVALDTYYISNWNLAMDVRILFKTIKVVLLGKGAK